jgi:HemY protein
MIRVFVFLFVIAVLALGAAWLADRPGDVAVTWLGYRIETSVTVAALALVLVMAAAMLLWSVLRALVMAPAKIGRKVADRRATKARLAITRGLVAIGAGDMNAARRYADQAGRYAADEPLALLLEAQTAQLAGDRDGAERSFRLMARRSDTKLLGLHGLFVEARRRDDGLAARAYAEEAAKTAPALTWATQAVLESRCAEGDWPGALAALESMMKAGLLDKPTYRRRRAVLLTGQALSRDTDRETAKAQVLEAVKLCPELVPAAALAGRFLFEAGEVRKATRIIEAAWRVSPHPDLAYAYANLHPADSARDRLGRVRALVRLAPDSLESALAMARAAIDAQEFTVARDGLKLLLEQPTQRVATLMAELEEAESGDIGRARAWMGKAVHAAPDPAWTADGFVSDKWLPVSPVTGRLDAFEWKVPVANLSPPGPMIEFTAPPPPPAITSVPPPAPPVAASPPSAPPVVSAAPAEVAAKPKAHSLAEPGDIAPPAAKSIAEPATAGGFRPAQPVIPLVHAPDDPGPEPDRETEPVVESQPGTWRKLRSLFA